MLLSNTDILRFRQAGAIVIEPFDEKALNNVSYDVTLGDTIYRYKPDIDEVVDLGKDDPSEMFKKCWASDPEEYCNWASRRGFYLNPGERILGHTREVVGGIQTKCRSCGGSGDQLAAAEYAHEECPYCKGNGTVAVTTQLHATSTLARIGLSVCQCAGWGDVSYIKNWTLEITNHSPRSLFLPVGAVVGQVSFNQVTPVIDGTTYDLTGNYQYGKEEFKPEMMLPKKLKVRP